MRILDGPFTEYTGTVNESNKDQKKVTVLISCFGKVAPVVVNFLQVEKIEPFFT